MLTALIRSEFGLGETLFYLRKKMVRAQKERRRADMKGVFIKVRKLEKAKRANARAEVR